MTCGRGWTSPHEPLGDALFTSPQANPIALSPDGLTLYVAKTGSNHVKIIDATTNSVIATRLVGIDPVSVAVRPGGDEVWIANHVSDSVSVLDTNPASPTFHQVIATIQDVDADGVTRFDEPVGIAFASAAKAYVALSSRNDIAVIDANTRQVSSRVHIQAQEPRAIAVRGGRLFVTVMESGNQSEISACPDGQSAGEPPENCTLGPSELFVFAASSPNVPGADKNIIIDPDLPDRDLFVFDTADESFIEAVSHVGTLLYGLSVDSNRRVFVAQTDARNTENGLEGDTLTDLGNRPFLNQIAVVDCLGTPCSFDELQGVHDLEEPPGTPVMTPLATPYGIAISDDDSTLVVSAAASSRIATIDASSPGLAGVLDTLDVGDIPRGVALRSDLGGAPDRAFVLNSLGNTVSVVDVTNPNDISLVTTIGLGGETLSQAIRRGRIAFNDAGASDSGTFACASCHPDGNTDQLLWRIGGACFFGACTGLDLARNAMPVRGLANTLPLHWDGTLGDPFGGPNGAVGSGGAGGTDCTLGDADGDHDCFLDLVEGSLSGVMCDQLTACPPGGKQLSAQERDDMATFLASVQYPPARSRRADDTLSASALDGFADFFTDQGGLVGNPDTCADSDAGCHTLPLGTDTNSATLDGFDAPTLRGMTDRFIQASLGATAAEEVLVAANAGGLGVPPNPFPWDPAEGMEESTTFGAGFEIFAPFYNVGPVDLFQMFEEASTGTSGATGRQLTLDENTMFLLPTLALLDDLEAADARDVINLYGDGVRDSTPVSVSYKAHQDLYQVGPTQLTRAQLEAEVMSGDLLVTLTGHLPMNFHVHPQALISPENTGAGPTGDPRLTFSNPLTVTGVDVRADARILLDGQTVAGALACNGGSFSPVCSSQLVEITFSVPPADGLRLLQLQNEAGPLSNEMPICVGSANGCD